MVPKLDIFQSDSQPFYAILGFPANNKPYRPRKNILVDGQLPENEKMNPQIAMSYGK